MLAQDKLRIYLSIVLLASAAWLLHGFVPALLWAGVIGVATWPLRERIANRTALGDTWVAVLMTALVATLLFLPIGYTLFHAAAEAGNVARWILDTQKSGIAVPPWLQNIPMVGHTVVEWWGRNLSDPAALSNLVGQGDNASLVDYARKFGAQVAHRLITLLFTIVVIFFIYRDGRELTRNALKLLNRLTGEGGDRYGIQAAAAIRATVSGLVLVGFAEGLLIGLAYVIADAPHPAVLTLATGILAIIPFGAPVIFGGVAAVLLVQGNTLAAVSVFAFGMLVLFIGDHFVRPKIIGDAVKLPFLWVLFGILGGVEVIGLIGLFVGPALMALVMTMWRDLTDQS